MSVTTDVSLAAKTEDVFRVMVVDDSAVIRGFLTRFIEEDPQLKVVQSVANGQMAITALASVQVDVIVLDIEMPVMDGLTALPLILKADSAVQVIIASTLTKENAAITLRCLQAGAAECLAKPTSQELAGSNSFKKDLVDKIKILAAVARKKRGNATVKSQVSMTTESAPAGLSSARQYALRPARDKFRPDVIAIGSSTGGPQALLQFFGDLKGAMRQPVFITQHMPPTFTAILAEHLKKQTGYNCKEAAEGDLVIEGCAYIAPGGFHMTVKNSIKGKIIALNQDPPENYCRPSVDPMLRSIVDVYGAKVLAVILTGMGADGLKGCQKVVESGGAVIAQDETTSVVWGMPGAVAMAGVCQNVLPLGLMAKEVRSYADLAR